MGEKKPVSQEEEPKPLSRKLKILTTIAIFYGNASYGCAANAFSPSLTDFKNKFETDTSNISKVFVASIVAYMTGALICTVLYNLVNRQLTVVFLFVGVSASLFLAPHIPNIGLFYADGALLGFCIGCYDSAQFVWIMEMWQDESGPYVQAQHFFYALGTVLSPLIMTPFLTEEESEDESGTSTTPETETKNDKLFIPFTILGCITSVTAVAQMLLFIFMRYRPPPPQIGEIENNDEASAELIKPKEPGLVGFVKNQWPGWKIARLVLLSVMTLGTYQGMEMATLQLYPTYGQNTDLELSESTSAKTLTGLTIAFAVGRGLAILFIFKVPAILIVYVNIGLCLIANVLLVIWGNTSVTIIYVSGVLFGLGFSSLLPSFCVFMERYLEFTNTIGAMMIVGGSFMGSIYPLIIGDSVERNSLIMTYPIFFSVAANILGASVSYYITRNTPQRPTNTKSTAMAIHVANVLS